MRDHNAPQANGQDSGSGGAAVGAGRVVHPLQQGAITDWEVLEACLDHALYDRVSCGGPDGGPARPSDVCELLCTVGC